VLRECQLAAPSVLLAEPDDIRPPLACVDQQREREPRLGSYRMPFLELLNFLNGPSVETF
jgi:hypothetical protein